MNADLLLQYFNQGIHPMYPDMSREPGKRVCTSTDGGPGRNNDRVMRETNRVGNDLLGKAPNTTSIAAEQDQLYGYLQQLCNENMEQIQLDRLAQHKTVQLSKFDIPRILTGCATAEFPLPLQNPCALAFTKERIIAAWMRVGVVPHTRYVLQNPQLRHENRPGDPMQETFAALNAKHAANVAVVEAQGMDATILRAKIPELPVTRVLSPEEVSLSDRIACPKKGGQQWMKIGDLLLNSEDAIAALNPEDSQKAAAAAVKVDTARELKLKLISSAKALREKEGDPEKWSSSDILLMLKYKKVSNVSQYTTKQSRLEKYQSCKDDESESDTP